MSYLVEKRRKRAAAIAGFSVFLIILCADLFYIARIKTKGLLPHGSFITELARTQEPIVMAALGCWAIAAVLLSLAVERALQPTAWVPLGLLLVRLQAVALAVVAVFPPGLVGDNAFHQIGYYAAMFFGSASPLVLAPAFRWDPEWTAFTWPGRLVSILSIGVVVGLMLWPPSTAIWWEISAVAVLLLWLLLCAAGVMRSVHWFKLPWEKVRKRM